METKGRHLVLVFDACEQRKAQAFKVYEQTMDQAQKMYDAAIAEAEKVFDHAMREADRVYGEAMGRRPRETTVESNILDEMNRFWEVAEPLENSREPRAMERIRCSLKTLAKLAELRNRGIEARIVVRPDAWVKIIVPGTREKQGSLGSVCS
ncbi:MAG: hypothetical protein HY694_00950 [Deltaproteobacteria bacterium]|nr:hypothetical protein [Deltaproteobacteria bacterium]